MFWKEVYVGLSLQAYTKATSILEDHSIGYRSKLKKREDNPIFRSPARTLLGRVGENINASTVYSIFVRRSDAEQANFILQHAQIENKRNR